MATNGRRIDVALLAEIAERWVVKPPYRDDPNAVDRVVNAAREVLGDKRKANGEIEAMRRAIGGLPWGVTIIDTEGRVILWNDAASRILDPAWAPGDPTAVDMPLLASKYLVHRYPSGEFVPQEEWPVSRALRGEETGWEVFCSSTEGCDAQRGDCPSKVPCERGVRVRLKAYPYRDTDGTILGGVSAFVRVEESNDG